jgi:hypothetical protein
MLGNSCTGVDVKKASSKQKKEEDKMTSRKKIDANRRDAQCSTGPRTTSEKR